VTVNGALLISLYTNKQAYAKYATFKHYGLKKKINATPNFTTMVTGHGNIKSHLHKYKILDSPMCSCKSGEQTADHILYDCKLLEQERDSLKAAVLRTENWPVSKNKFINKFHKNLKKIYEQYTL